jgi:hypothetical protein
MLYVLNQLDFTPAVKIASNTKHQDTSHSFINQNTPNTYTKRIRMHQHQSKTGTNTHPNALTSFPFVPKYLSVSYSQFTLPAIQSRNPLTYLLVSSFIAAHATNWRSVAKNASALCFTSVPTYASALPNEQFRSFIRTVTMLSCELGVMPFAHEMAS